MLYQKLHSTVILIDLLQLGTLDRSLISDLAGSRPPGFQPGCPSSPSQCMQVQPEGGREGGREVEREGGREGGREGWDGRVGEEGWGVGEG